MQWNHRGQGAGGNPVHASFDGILLREWHSGQGLVGEAVNIWPGTARGLTEAPHLFRRGGWYYLTTAEGGTGYGHAVTMARARDIRGPSETHPDLHLITAADAPGHPTRRAGHGQYVEAEDGTVWHTFLMGRPIAGPDGQGRFCPLGRETGLERCVWRDDGWLYLEGGGLLPRLEVPHEAASPDDTAPASYAFSGPLHPDFQWLRTPDKGRLFRTGDGALTLIGRESLGSWFEQALVARRQQHFRCRTEVRVEFAPETYQEAAGPATCYNRHKFRALVVTHEPGVGRALDILSCPGDWPAAALSRPLARPVPVPDGPLDLAVEVDHARQRFFWREHETWRQIGPVFDASVISDEGGRGEHGSFTGAFVGMVAFDITGKGREARFTRFSYAPG